MISKLTRVQLVVFAIVTVLGGAFVGGRYAQIDRLVIDRTYPVTVELPDSGGIFAGAQVTYRGIPVGKVAALKFTEAGVEAELDIENSSPDIPADLTAVVANKSAIGEQFMDLQPKSAGEPFLRSGSRISQDDARIPLDTATLLIDINDLVKSVDTENLSTVVEELGQAFEGTGEDLGTILDTSSQYVEAATENLPITR
ncbi:MAG TPA: MlaD family protein, partial [Aeromicrobium sp.]|nr:MlaD family protein [Aeromicrobium sp.]